ncbi:MAG: hypothetical protein CUN54_08720, partial [Phototrophicales bacterium]
MSAYLVVDVDDLLQRFDKRGIIVDLQELAVGLRGGAALAAGLPSADQLRAIAVANWDTPHVQSLGAGVDARRVFEAAGYETFDISHRESMADALIMHYFSFDPEPIDELILVTTNPDLIPLVRRVQTTRHARIRVWGSEDVLKGTEFADDVIFQPVETLLGIQTKNVAVYIDFENIAISLKEQGFVINLDHLIDRFVQRAKAYGHLVKMAAYAPWGQRGSLPPLVDSAGREIADEAPSRLMLASIDPLFTLPGKNSADVRIARDVMTDASHSDAADVFIIASGDRDFNDVINSLKTRNKTIIVWGVRGSTSRQLENNPSVTVEYIEDFTDLQTHESFGATYIDETGEMPAIFTPSQWSSVIIQFDRLAAKLDTDVIPMQQLIQQLHDVGAVVSLERGEDLVSQAMSLGILKAISASGDLTLNPEHTIVQKTRLIRDRIMLRVYNTLDVRNWEYVNYGFLLKGLAMDYELNCSGCNLNDQWRSDWIDCLVREGILVRELVPHRHNPEDLVPVIKLPTEIENDALPLPPAIPHHEMPDSWEGLSLEELYEIEPETANMAQRVVVSVEQFTSFRNFTWCPL